jgi:hypothetical protein
MRVLGWFIAEKKKVRVKRVAAVRGEKKGGLVT